MANETFVTVKAAKEDSKVVLWEKDPLHPDGEIFITGDGVTHKVAKTAAVQRALADGKLVESHAAPAHAAPAADAKPAAKKE
jgi:hypothetical protein